MIAFESHVMYFHSLLRARVPGFIILCLSQSLPTLILRDPLLPAYTSTQSSEKPAISYYIPSQKPHSRFCTGDSQPSDPIDTLYYEVENVALPGDEIT